MDKPPLIVDLDGTLTPADTLLESVLKLIRQSPLNLIWLILQLPKGKAAFKGFVAAHCSFSPATLPYNQALLNYLRAEKGNGRRLILATASHKTTAAGVCKHLGLFDDVIATDSTNLKGELKLVAIRRLVGEDFVYAGDSPADLPIWKAAKAGVLVNANAATSRAARKLCPMEAEFTRDQARTHSWTRTLRVHQWLKNLLLFVPALTAFSFLDTATLLDLSIAFLAFSLTASATYILNDLLDLENDRKHRRKRLRPLANAEVSIQHALLIMLACLSAGLILAGLLSSRFLLILAVYFTLTSAYSWKLKQYVLIDVVILSLLYTLRIIAGSIAIEVTTSAWLLAFSVFIFLSLALIKRCSELMSLKGSGIETAIGRDYRVSDLTVLWPLGVGAAMASIVVFGLFINSPETISRYATPPALWLVALGLIYWLSRLWINTARGEMHDDPIVHSIKDRGSRMAILAMALAFIAAHFVEMGKVFALLSLY